MLDLSNIKDLITKRNLAIIGGIFLLSISLAFGLGYTLARNNNPAPIIIQKN